MHICVLVGTPLLGTNGILVHFNNHNSMINDWKEICQQHTISYVQNFDEIHQFAVKIYHKIKMHLVETRKAFLNVDRMMLSRL